MKTALFIIWFNLQPGIKIKDIKHHHCGYEVVLKNGKHRITDVLSLTLKGEK